MAHRDELVELRKQAAYYLQFKQGKSNAPRRFMTHMLRSWIVRCAFLNDVKPKNLRTKDGAWLVIDPAAAGELCTAASYAVEACYASTWFEAEFTDLGVLLSLFRHNYSPVSTTGRIIPYITKCAQAFVPLPNFEPVVWMAVIHTVSHALNDNVMGFCCPQRNTEGLGIADSWLSAFERNVPDTPIKGHTFLGAFLNENPEYRSYVMKNLKGEL